MDSYDDDGKRGTERPIDRSIKRTVLPTEKPASRYLARDPGTHASGGAVVVVYREGLRGGVEVLRA